MESDIFYITKLIHDDDIRIFLDDLIDDFWPS